jgi:nucleoside-diphosphate-sugar epimerase
MDKVLLTGASGFIGGHLAEELIRRGCRVTCLVRRTSRTSGLERLRLRLVAGDYMNPASLEEALRGQDTVFHLAAVLNGRDWEAYYRANTLSTQNLVEACLKANAGLGSFVFVSSISAVGPSSGGRRLDEEAPCRPISSYGRSKLAAEQAVKSTGDRLPWVIIRPPNVLGPRQSELLQAIHLVRRGIMPVVGTGLPQTSVCDVEDLVRALILAAEKREALGQTYLVTDGEDYAWQDITLALAEELGVRKMWLRLPYGLQYSLAWLAEGASRLTNRPPLLSREMLRSGHRFEWLYDGGKIRRQLGFSARFTMRDSVRRAVAWYRQRGPV